MTQTFKLEWPDGTPANPPSLTTMVLVWAPEDQIPLGSRTLQVVRVRHDEGGGLPVLVVQDVA